MDPTVSEPPNEGADPDVKQAPPLLSIADAAAMFCGVIAIANGITR